MSPGSRPRAQVGIVGGGQLARMMVQAAISLDIGCRVLAAPGDESAAGCWADVVIGDPTDPEELERFCSSVEVTTFDHERVPVAVLQGLERQGHVLRPGSGVFALTDKGTQRDRFAAAGFPVPAFASVPTAADVAAFADRTGGWPVVLKQRHGGYDGRGVAVAGDEEEAIRFMSASPGAEFVAERFLDLEQELAVIVVRRPSGEVVVYPTVGTEQVDHMCHAVVAPAPVDDGIARAAAELAVEIAHFTEVVGVLAIELFVVDGTVLVNEIAPRPHNTGHLTIEACRTSQFENHLRAVLDWPLGATDLVSGGAAMVNIVGGDPPVDTQIARLGVLEDAVARLHLYGKTARPGRKLGHVTVLSDNADDALARAERAAQRFMGGPR
jgi:5-(carboxyamino)imidazole ribonucleotide synthase